MTHLMFWEKITNCYGQILLGENKGFFLLKMTEKLLSRIYPRNINMNSCYVCPCVFLWTCQVCTTRQTAGWSYPTSSRITTRCTACRAAPVIFSLSRRSTRQEAATVSPPASRPTVSGGSCLFRVRNITRRPSWKLSSGRLSLVYKWISSRITTNFNCKLWKIKHRLWCSTDFCHGHSFQHSLHESFPKWFVWR